MSFLVLQSCCESKWEASAKLFCAGKGTQAPKIKEKFSCCHLVRCSTCGGKAILMLVLGYWRYVAITSCEEDTIGPGS